MSAALLREVPAAGKLEGELQLQATSQLMCVLHRENLYLDLCGETNKTFKYITINSLFL